MENDNDLVVYIQCPHCHKGWYGKELGYEISEVEGDKSVLKHYNVQGIDVTDISKPIKCLNCGKEYTPVTGVYFDWERGEYRCEGDTIVSRTWNFVANLITTCVGK